MGVLDDAIRQHLELKRTHGADEAELQRKENEALGPVRREAEPAAEEAADPAPPPAEDAPVEEVPAEEPVVEEPVAFTDDEPFADGELFAEAPVVEEAPPPAEQPPAGEPRTSNTPTRGFDALSDEDLPEEPPAPAGDTEDVLEETPEFLQETPEHDRLWFEQKAPRDFDFDDDDQK